MNIDAGIYPWLLVPSMKCSGLYLDSVGVTIKHTKKSWLATISRTTPHTLVEHTDIWLRANEPHLADSGNPSAGPCSTSATDHPAWEWVGVSALACRRGKAVGSDGT